VVNSLSGILRRRIIPRICLPVPCWVCTSWVYPYLHTLGTPPSSSIPATVQAPGHRERRLAALTLGVTERTVTDEELTVRSPVSLLVVVEREGSGCAESPGFLWERRSPVANSVLPSSTRFTVGRAQSVTILIRNVGNQAGIPVGPESPAQHPFHCWKTEKTVIPGKG